MIEYNNLAIYCDNYEENEMFLSYCEDIGLRWRTGSAPLAFVPSDGIYKNYFVISDNRITYGRVEDYEDFTDRVEINSKNLRIVNLYEFIGSNVMPTTQDLIDFLNEEKI